MHTPFELTVMILLPSHAAAASLLSSELRLVNGSGPNSGRLEALYEGQWAPVASVNASQREFIAAVACRQLGYSLSSPAIAEHPSAFGRSVLKPWLRVIGCYGNETRLMDCTCPFRYDSAGSSTTVCKQHIYAGLVDGSYDQLGATFGTSGLYDQLGAVQMAVTCPTSASEQPLKALCLCRLSCSTKHHVLHFNRTPAHSPTQHNSVFNCHTTALWLCRPSFQLRATVRN